MNLTIVYPSRAHQAYKIAANEFSFLAKQVSGANTQLITDDDNFMRNNNQADLIVLIGNDAVNSANKAAETASNVSSALRSNQVSVAILAAVNQLYKTAGR